MLAILSVLSVVRAKTDMARSLRHGIGRMRRDGKLPYSEEADLEFAEYEIIETTESSVQKFRYDEVRIVGETDEHVFILVGAMQGIILPKAFLNGQDAELMRWMKEKTHN